MDLEIEYDNKLFKIDCYSYRGEIIERIVQRVGRGLMLFDEIVRNFDEILVVKRFFGKYIIMFIKEDVLVFVEYLFFV